MLACCWREDEDPFDLKYDDPKVEDDEYGLEVAMALTGVLVTDEEAEAFLSLALAT